ncbi:MAG: endonuclease III [Solirubrobacterales bacterium]
MPGPPQTKHMQSPAESATPTTPPANGRRAGGATRVRRRRSGWSPPRAARVRAIRDKLRATYGRPEHQPHRRAIDEIVRTILSQHTNDLNRDRAFNGLVERFGDWASVRDAPVSAVEEAIRPGGLAKQKAPRIQAVLAALGDPPDADWLEHAGREQALSFLTSLPGVGRKTAACVQIFSWGLPEIPVDVHVYRVGGRLGLFRRNASFEEAHDEMLAITDPRDAYELHVNLIRHGRQICRPKPRCGECGLRRACPWYREQGQSAR